MPRDGRWIYILISKLNSFSEEVLGIPEREILLVAWKWLQKTLQCRVFLESWMLLSCPRNSTECEAPYSKTSAIWPYNEANHIPVRCISVSSVDVRLDTKQIVQIVQSSNTYDLCLGGAEFEFRPKYWHSWLIVSWFFSPLKRM